jgi:WD40 repeat protein
VAGVLDMGAGNQINSVVFRADGECLFIGNQSYTIVVWELSPKSDAGHIVTDRHAGPITSIAISADDRILVSGSEDKTVKVWDLSTKRVHTLTGHTNYVTSVAISKDGQTIVSGSADKTIKVWGYKEFWV